MAWTFDSSVASNWRWRFSRRIREDRDHWVVPSQSGDGRYSVWPGEQRCLCPDHQIRRVKCKHIFAVEYAIEHRVEADGSETVTERARHLFAGLVGLQRRSDRGKEGERLRTMLAYLCSLVEQPEQRMGRPRLPMSEMAFASVLKVYSGFSSVLCHNLSVLIHAIHHIGLAEDEIGFSR